MCNKLQTFTKFIKSVSFVKYISHRGSAEANKRDFPLQFSSGDGNSREDVAKFFIDVYRQIELLMAE